MTWPSVICFRALICVLASMAGRQLVARIVSGQIQLVESEDSAVKTKKDYSGVAVWLTSSEWKGPQAPLRKHVRMLQKNKTFLPHILAIETGTSVDFPNLDPIFHNAFSNFDGQIFDVALYPPGSSKTVKFERPGVVRVFCNIHPSMSAIIVVANSNYIAITNREGRYVFPNVAPGEYQIHFFHERATPETLEGVEKKITVSDQPAELPLTVVSEAGYLPTGHKNKYGQDYPANSEADSYSLPLQ
jgi:plastocyanin